MSINRKIGAAITATMLLAFNVSSSPPATAIFRPKCTADASRGIGWVAGTTTSNSVALKWSTAPTASYQKLLVCYKKSWSLDGKCENGKQHPESYASAVSYGTIIIGDLDKDSCYKFAVYGADVGKKLIGIQKIKTK